MGEDNTASDTPIGGVLAHSVSGDVSVQNCLYFGNSMNTLPSKGAIVGVISSGAVSTTALSQNFYCTPQSGIKGIGHYERAISPAGGNRDIDLTDHHGAVCAHVVTADADIADMGSADTPLTPGGITPYANGVMFNDVHYSHILALEATTAAMRWQTSTAASSTSSCAAAASIAMATGTPSACPSASALRGLSSAKKGGKYASSTPKEAIISTARWMSHITAKQATGKKTTIYTSSSRPQTSWTPERPTS